MFDYSGNIAVPRTEVKVLSATDAWKSLGLTTTGWCEPEGLKVDADGIRQLTKDHSLVQMMVERGELTPELARTYPGKNLITRAIGTEPMVMCDIFHLELSKGDFLLLCSDGLSNMMDEQEILFEVAHGVNKQYCCQRLLDIAKNRGAPDNVTSILIAV